MRQTSDGAYWPSASARPLYRSHESIVEDPVVLVLDPLSFDGTLTEHRERLLAGGEVLENLVDAPVVEGAPLIGVAVGVPSADRGVARGAARPHVAVVEHHDPCTGVESRVEKVKPARKSAQRHVAPPAADERPVDAAITEPGERVCIHGLEPHARRHLLAAGRLYRLGVQVGSEPLACKRRAGWRPPAGTARDL